MNILEKEIEDLIWHGINHDKSSLTRKGLFVSSDMIYRRQFDLGSYGISDLLGYSIRHKREGRRRVDVHLLEIKKDDVNIQTLLQALRYCKGIERILKERLNGIDLNIRISLIGRRIEKDSDFIFMPDFFKGLELYTYHLDFNHGISFKPHSHYSQVDEKFPDLQREITMLQGIYRDRPSVIQEDVEEELPF